MTDARASLLALRGLCPVLVVAALLVSPPLAAADPPAAPRPTAAPAAAAPLTPPGKKSTAAERDSARALALDGFEKLQRGQLDEAVDLFLQAEAHFHAPTHQMYLAQAYDKKGQLLRAAAAYRSVAAETLPRDAPQPFLDARAEATPALERLLRRIPKLRVEVTGVTPANVQILVRDRAVLPGASTDFDPGTYHISATGDGADGSERTVELRDDGVEVVVRFALARRISLAWPLAAFGLGLAAGGVAVTTGILSFNESRRFETVCTGSLGCTVVDLRTNESAGRLGDAAIATGIASSVLFAVGVTLLFIHPTSKARVEPAGAASDSAMRLAPTIALRLGPSFTGLAGTF